jgi:hypothetical protein
MKTFLTTSFLLSAVLFSACSGASGPKDFSVHSSTEGEILERFIPADVGVVFSYSLRADEQFASMQALQDALGENSDFFDTITDALDEEFVGTELNYDLAEVLGEQFRLVLGTRQEAETSDSFAVVTLEDPAAMAEVLKDLTAAGELENKKLSKVDAYVNEEGDFYGAMEGDVFMVANRPEGLVAMASKEDNLWDLDAYQDGLESVGSDYMFYAFVFPSFIEAADDALAGVGRFSSVIERQTFVGRAQENGIVFDMFVDMDQDAAGEAGVSFDAVPRSKAYLHKEVPAEGLIAYFESYGLKQTFDEANNLDGNDESIDAIAGFFQAYFAMDFQEDFLGFFDKGYSMSIHQNGTGVVPGFSIIADVSSDEAGAEDFINKLDGQLSGLLAVLQTALPGAVTKGTTTIAGNNFSILEIDLNAVGRTETGHSPLPSAVTESAIQLAYGLIDGKLLVTTAEVWETNDGVMIDKSELYKNLDGQLKGVDEGLILMDAQALAKFIVSLDALREQLGLGVNEEGLDFEGLLNSFVGGIAASQTEKYQTHFGGLLLINE